MVIVWCNFWQNRFICSGFIVKMKYLNFDVDLGVKVMEKNLPSLLRYVFRPNLNKIRPAMPEKKYPDPRTKRTSTELGL